jgi:hypothetical protein
VERCFQHILFLDPPTPPRSPLTFMSDDDESENYSFDGCMCGEDPVHLPCWA